MTKNKQLCCACALALVSVAHAQSTDTEIIVHTFRGSPDGAGPASGVIGDGAGNIYGTTENGGTANAGVVYKIDAAGQESVLYSFTGQLDGQFPTVGVIRDTAGNLYGTTQNGGTANVGVVYRIDAAGQETVLYSFTGQLDGKYPSSGVIRDAGNLYGTTAIGGRANFGVVYKLDATGQETVLHTFTGGDDGEQPTAGVIRDAAGNLYGTTRYGGARISGVVYKVDVASHQTVLYNFMGWRTGEAPWPG